jgi:glutamate dehydrogenase (NAD(P)+)
VNVQQLVSAKGFIVFDLEGAPSAICTARQARAVPEATAALLARSTTYQLATFGQKVGGAAAGINAKPDDRARAIGAFVTEVADQVERGELLVNPGRGVSAESLRPLRKLEHRNPVFWSDGPALRGIGIAVAADAAVGLDGRRVVIEGYDDAGDALVRAIEERGGRVIAVSTARGTAQAPSTLDVDAMVEAHEFHGASFVKELGVDVGPPGAAFELDADVLIVGSDLGVIDEAVAAHMTAGAIVPSGPAPITGGALATLRRAGTIVLPDFVSTSGPLFAMSPRDDPFETVRSAASAAIGEAIADVLHDAEGPFIGACARAEAFLRSWCEQLPSSRPLAADVA